MTVWVLPQARYRACEVEQEALDAALGSLPGASAVEPLSDAPNGCMHYVYALGGDDACELIAAWTAYARKTADLGRMRWQVPPQITCDVDGLAPVFKIYGRWFIEPLGYAVPPETIQDAIWRGAGRA